MEHKFPHTKQHNCKHKATSSFHGQTSTSKTESKREPEQSESSSGVAARCCKPCRIVRDLVAEYQSLPAAFNQDLESGTSSCSVDFIELFRKRLHYEQLGVPLTSLELVYMGGCKCAYYRQQQKQRKPTHQDNSTQTGDDLLESVHGLQGGRFCDCESLEAMWQESCESEQGTITVDLDRDCSTCQAKRRSQLQRNRYTTPPPSPFTPPFTSPSPSSAMSLLSAMSLPSLPPPPHTPRSPPPRPRPPPPSPPPPPSSAEQSTWDEPTSTCDFSSQIDLRGNEREPLAMARPQKPFNNVNWEHEDDSAQSMEHGTDRVLAPVQRRAANTIELPARATAGQEAGCRAADRGGDWSDGLEVLVPPGAPRVLLNEQLMTGILTAKSMQLTATSSQFSSTVLKSLEGTGLRHGSTDTLNAAWCNAGKFVADSPTTCPGCPKPWAIDALYVGSTGAAILSEKSANKVIMRSALHSREFEGLNRKQRAQGIGLRLQQLRKFQEKTNASFLRKLKEIGPCHMHRKRPGKPQAMVFECPLGTPNCASMANRSLLAHFLKVHLTEPGLALNEVFRRDQVLITFKPRTFVRSQNYCLSMIVFTDHKRDSDNILITPYQPVYNAGLPGEYAKFAGHLPLLVMACRTRLFDYDAEDKRRQQQKGRNEGKYAAEEPPLQTHVLGLWMVSMELIRPLHVYMTVFNRRVDVSRSSIMEVRGINRCHNFEKFMPLSKNYLRLTGQDLRLLTNDYKDPIYLELSVRDHGVVLGFDEPMKMHRAK